jgi:hypothetical protein
MPAKEARTSQRRQSLAGYFRCSTATLDRGSRLSFRYRPEEPPPLQSSTMTGGAPDNYEIYSRRRCCGLPQPLRVPEEDFNTFGEIGVKGSRAAARQGGRTATTGTTTTAIPAKSWAAGTAARLLLSYSTVLAMILSHASSFPKTARRRRGPLRRLYLNFAAARYPRPSGKKAKAR